MFIRWDKQSSGMAALRLYRRPLRWGNGYGIRITQAEMKELGVDPAAPLEVEILASPPPIDLSKLHLVRSGTRTASLDHDKLAGEGYHVRR